MVFSSAVFLLVFLPVFLITYYLVGSRLKNYTILLFSIFFYAWGAPDFVFVVLGSMIVNFYVVQSMQRAATLPLKRLLLALSVAINLGLLLYFKYANFFIENINALISALGLGSDIPWAAVALPVGISFFTFQSLTYSVDVYRKVHAPLQKLSDYILYILMFPQLIAGPIVRFNFIADQITNRQESADDRLLGMFRFIIGLAKKVLIANVLGAEADRIMALDPAAISSATAWMGILAYTFQIYFDFAGYSDMAIGVGRMIGFTFPENFNNPYVSQSITEFWRRWHITLGAWMRDYLYIPLGGNRVKTQRRLYFNLWFVFLVSGLWHGASWNFVIWGGYHGLFLILDRIFLLKLLKRSGKVFSTIFTFFVVVMGWVFFRVEDFATAMIYFQRLFAFDFGATSLVPDPEVVTILMVAIIFSFITVSKAGLQLQEKVFYAEYPPQRKYVMFACTLVLFVLSLASVTTSGFNPFIYFRF
ncbi:MAG: MBOAT family O-acyltransferase [Bacteroidales bacterium]|jgi:alginate O-acetyltransferase complex protein AlgI|nr:MBOAT family protein [Bacteroidales bacterium]NCU35504.1 MBOAT family protein [Candidatus Falkowbacteria bacterium]MDD3525803.1 MBOAT family protein [Bacteroidales bacterium]MDD4177515.1 MBOAT family protein [Bacteroidales bacterium]MDD4741805.1 MBOAT family protein [Bacteroidales bacterium]